MPTAFIMLSATLVDQAPSFGFSAVAIVARGNFFPNERADTTPKC